MKLYKLRELMKQNHIDAYIIVTDDFHGSEYVGEYFKAREYMSGFTGSAGTLVVLPEWCGLWTDGRYFLQAESELSGCEISLMKSGETGVPSIEDFLRKNLAEGSVIGFDGRTISCSFAARLSGFNFVFDKDFVDEIWENRPAISKEPVWELSTDYVGITRSGKISLVKNELKDGEHLVITALDEIAWLLNLRGNDVACTPVFLSFMIITKDETKLFIHGEILNEKIEMALTNDGVSIFDYKDIYESLQAIPKDEKVIIDCNTANFMIKSSINATLIEKTSPIVQMKSVKNPTEMNNIKMAHLKDGVAVTKFIKWLKENIEKGDITELSSSVKLEGYRREQEGYLGPSFTPIVGYGEHGAIIHYDPTEESNVKIKPHGLCLIDTGGHYLEGTTDITRTIPLGPLTDEEKKAYTLVLRGHLALANAKFKSGLTGANLDYLARSPLWEHGMDYNHGTGHGVGYLLSVHEGPQRIHWKASNVNTVLVEGMVVSDEPGYYEPGKFGIRHENLLMVRAGKKTAYGQFMYFDNLTMVPFDPDGVDTQYLSDKEIEMFNRYQMTVFNNLKEYFHGVELEWLREYTKEI